MKNITQSISYVFFKKLKISDESFQKRESQENEINYQFINSKNSQKVFKFPKLVYYGSDNGIMAADRCE